jgi:hypothetical protein
LSEPRKKALDRWLEADEEDEKISKIKDKIKLLLYNKRNLIMDKRESNALDTSNQGQISKKSAKSSTSKIPSKRIPKNDSDTE